MADDILTVADLVSNTLDISDAEVSDLLRDSTLIPQLPFTPSSNGDVHKYVKETGAPVVGYRAETLGRDHDHSVDTLVTVNLKILDFSWHVDKAVADSHIRGSEWLVAREGRRHFNSAMFTFEQTVLNGTFTASGGHTGGFNGFANSLNSASASMVVNAGGTTANTGSSAYLIRAGMDDVSAVLIQDKPIDLGETIVQDFVTSDSKHMPAYYTPASTWVGVQVGSAYSLGRICNLTEDSGKGLTDDLVFDAISKFPANRRPTHIVCNRRSLFQLRSSRTATNGTGAPAPIPTEVAGIPITVTDAITNTEALLT